MFWNDNLVYQEQMDSGRADVVEAGRPDEMPQEQSWKGWMAALTRQIVFQMVKTVRFRMHLFFFFK